MNEPTKIATDLYRVDTKVTGTDMPLAIYLLEGPGWLVTDTGCVGMMRELAIPAARSLRPDATIDRAVVTHAHADHFGGNAELLGANPGCEIFVHRLDAAWAREPAWHVRDAYDALGADYPCPEDVKAWVAGLLGDPTPISRLDAGDTVHLHDGRDLHVIHLPGHSPGHVGLWEPEEALLLMSDAILANGQAIDGTVVAIPAYLSVDDYLASIRVIRALDPAIACPSHYPVMDREATRRFCDESEAFVHRLDEAVRDALGSDRPHTLREITARVVPVLAPEADATMTAGLSVQAHLDALHRHGMASFEMDGNVRTWRTA